MLSLVIYYIKQFCFHFKEHVQCIFYIYTLYLFAVFYFIVYLGTM